VLTVSAQQLLTQDLKLLDSLDEEIKQTEQWLKSNLDEDRRMEILLTVPGLGQLLGAVVALEIDTIERFSISSLCGISSEHLRLRGGGSHMVG
jgi:transposase